MARVVIVTHHLRPQAVELAREAVVWLSERGHEVCFPADDARVVGAPSLGCPEEELADGAVLAVSLGGDGTILRTVDLVAATGVPVLGVNVGHMGYLTEVEPSALRPALDRFFAGAFRVEERMTLEVRVETTSGETKGEPHVALNEAVVEKLAPGHTVRLAVSVNDRFFTTYAADGLIVATPTGSTAYNFSARGPIVSPRHRALLMTPVSPHMLFDRSLVLDPVEAVRLEVIDPRVATLAVDGQEMGHLQMGEAIVCAVGPHDARLVTFGDRDFHRILKVKFGLADR